MPSRKITLPQPITDLKKWRLEDNKLTGIACRSRNVYDFPDGTFCRFFDLMYVVSYPAGQNGPAYKYARIQGGFYVRLFEHEEEGYAPQPGTESS